jgi:hypothetical protein
MIKFGQRANRWEVKLNRVLLGGRGLSIIPVIPEKVAFEKGIDWFIEIFFFYGVLFALTFYEINKAEQAK